MTRARPVGRTLSEAWLRLLFWHTAHAPWIPRAFKPVMTSGAWACSPSMRRGTLANAGRLLGPGCSSNERRKLARAVVANFFDEVVDFGVNRGRTREDLLARLESVCGEELYENARRRRQGAIMATAHLGSFETGMAMLGGREPRVHVVFKRDPFPLFERLRAEQHERLGILEAPVDDGMGTWVRLRDALLADEVVLMQADRVMPGQPGVEVPFLGGHIRLPTGPVKLARITGAPIIPVFAARSGGGRVSIEIMEPIWTTEIPAPLSKTASIDPAMLRLAGALESGIRKHPDQWLCLHAAWTEDQPPHAGA